MSMNENARDECVSEDLLPIAINFCASKDFMNEISDFKLKHAIVFDNVNETKEDNDGGEFPHEYHAIFIQYQQLVDDAFERLADEQGFTTKSLYRCFTDAVDGKFTVLFEEHEHKWFVDQVLGWMDLKEFVRMMGQEARRSTGRTVNYGRK